MLNLLKNKFDPTHVLVVYENEELDKNYIEIHDVKKGIIKEGRPLKKKTLADLLINCSGKTENLISFKTMMPESVLWYNCNPYMPSIAWFQGPQQKKIKFDHPKPKISSGFAYLPPCIFHYTALGNNLSVFAVNTPNKSDITMETQLYHFPLPNIYEGGEICMGDVNMEVMEKAKFIDDIMEFCTNQFYSSVFTEFHNEAPLKVNVYEFWTEHMGKPKLFPLDILKETGKKLNKLCKD